MYTFLQRFSGLSSIPSTLWAILRVRLGLNPFRNFVAKARLTRVCSTLSSWRLLSLILRSSSDNPHYQTRVLPSHFWYCSSTPNWLRVLDLEIIARETSRALSDFWSRGSLQATKTSYSRTNLNRTSKLQHILQSSSLTAVTEQGCP